MVAERDYHFCVYTGWVPTGSDFSLDFDKHRFSEPGLVATLEEGQRVQVSVFSSDAGMVRFERAQASQEDGNESIPFHMILIVEAKNSEVARERVGRIYRDALGRDLSEEAYRRASTYSSR